MDQERFVDINHELATLIALKTEFFRSVEHTTDEVRAYAKFREPAQELFAELARSKAE